MTDILELVQQESEGEIEIIDVTDEDFESSELEDATQMSEGKARELTSAIKAAAEATYILLARAHQGKAYKALGYSTWADYVKTEFDGMSTQRSYQFLNQAKIIKEIEAVAPEGTSVKLTEAQARDIKRELPFITSRIAEETEDLDADEAAAKIDEIVRESREQKKLEDEAVALKEKKLAEAEQEGYQAGLEAGADAILAADGFDLTAGEDREDDEDENNGWGVDSDSDSGSSIGPQLAMDITNFVNVLAGVQALPSAEDFIDGIPESRWEDTKKKALEAAEWFANFNELAKNRD